MPFSGFAGVTNPENGLRRSLCSYRVAPHKDAARVAVILCHSSPRMLYQHYKSIATAADAEAYFGIKPWHYNALCLAALQT